MEEKELKVTPPDGYVIDKENSTFECIKFKKELRNYEDVARNLFFNKNYYFLSERGLIELYTNNDNLYFLDSNNSTSRKQLERLLAINKLINVAKCLNGDWKPNWNNALKLKYYLRLNMDENLLEIGYTRMFCSDIVYFKSKELAQQAIDILGENNIRLVLSTDW